MGKCLVTGGCGFIGSHIVDKLISLGHKVLVIDNLSAKDKSGFHFNKKASYHEEDVADYGKILPFFKNVDYVFHLAAMSKIGYCLENPQEACRVNYLGVCSVLEASRRFNIKRVVYSSTSSVYGLKNRIPLKEHAPIDCLNPYSASKAAGEELCRMYYKLWGLETVILRYFNVFGERQPTMGQYAPVIGIFLKQKREGKKMTIVGDGRQTRDYTHVSDVVEANIRATYSGNNKAVGETINVGSGKRYSILDIAKMIGGKYNFIPKRKGEARDTLADITKLKKFLSVIPRGNLRQWIEYHNE